MSSRAATGTVMMSVPADRVAPEPEPIAGKCARDRDEHVKSLPLGVSLRELSHVEWAEEPSSVMPTHRWRAPANTGEGQHSRAISAAALREVTIAAALPSS
eukprot:scaffold129484_cov63-Phaeocystis_antarctica.AAC.5